MVKVLVSEEPYVQCPKCDVFRKPESYTVKGKKRKTCACCRAKK